MAVYLMVARARGVTETSSSFISSSSSWLGAAAASGSSSAMAATLWCVCLGGQVRVLLRGCRLCRRGSDLRTDTCAAARHVLGRVCVCVCGVRKDAAALVCVVWVVRETRRTRSCMWRAFPSFHAWLAATSMTAHPPLSHCTTQDSSHSLAVTS